MELKQFPAATITLTPSSFNRTRVELKLVRHLNTLIFFHSFNRTRVELKQIDSDTDKSRVILLIVPEWN